VQVLHEVPIRIVTDPSETLAYTEPPVCGDSDAAVPVIFPSRDFKGLKNVVERMRSVNDWIRITTRRGVGAHAGGECEIDGCGTASLELRVEKPELVSIKTTYPRLGVPSQEPENVVDDAGSGERGDSGAVATPTGGGQSTAEASGSSAKRRRLDAVGEEASASVEVRKLLRVLQSLSSSDLKIQNAIVCVVPSAMVILKIYLQDDTASSFLLYYLPVLAGADEDLV
jgi:hypothetical protein